MGESPHADVRAASRDVPGRRGEREQRTERARMQHGREEVQHGDAILHACVPRPEHRPPEEQRREQEARVLQRVHCFIGERRLEQQRHVPQPECGGVDREGAEGMGGGLPGHAPRRTARPRRRLRSRAQRQRPCPGCQGPAEDEERRGRDHQQLVLDHVRGEELRAESIERRAQRQHERSSSRPRTLPLPRAKRLRRRARCATAARGRGHRSPAKPRAVPTTHGSACQCSVPGVPPPCAAATDEAAASARAVSPCRAER